MKSILFAIIIGISVNIQPAEAQPEEKKRDSRLEELSTQAVQIAQQAIERAEQVGENELFKEDRELKWLRELEELREQLRNKSQELRELIEKVNPAKKKELKELKGKSKELIGLADWFEKEGNLRDQLRNFKATEVPQVVSQQSAEQGRDDSGLEGLSTQAIQTEASQIVSQQSAEQERSRLLQELIAQLKALMAQVEKLSGISRLQNLIKSVQQSAEDELDSSLQNLMEEVNRLDSSLRKILDSIALVRLKSISFICRGAFRKNKKSR